MQNVAIRPATEQDAAALLKIYAPYVQNTAITFEYTVPTVEEFKARIANTLKKYPYLVAEQNGRPLGYAYTGPFKERAAYEWAVETSIYLDPSARKMGLGRQLYTALEAVSKAQGVLNFNACIACTNQPDEHLNNNSLQFHHHLGFTTVGTFCQCGYKFGIWYNMVWVEKLLAKHPAALPLKIKLFSAAVRQRPPYSARRALVVPSIFLPDYFLKNWQK